MHAKRRQSARMEDKTADRDDLEILDSSVRRELVRAALEDDRAELASWAWRELYGMGEGARVYRIGGTASIGSRTLPWSAVTKLFKLDGTLHGASADSRNWNYWKREWHLYQASWLADLRGLVAPRFMGAGEVRDIAWVAMEDLTPRPPPVVVGSIAPCRTTHRRIQRSIHDLCCNTQ